MVAGEEVHLDTGIHKVHEGRKHPDISLGHDVAVLVPEIPDVAKKVKGVSPVRRYGLEEGDETGLAGGGVLDVKAQMDVGCEICQSPSGHVCIMRR